MPKLDFAQLLMMTIERKASDLHLTVGNPPMIRLHGSIMPMDDTAAPLSQEDVHASFYDILTEDQRKRLERDKELDFALELRNVGRFRVNVFYTRRGEQSLQIVQSLLAFFKQGEIIYKFAGIAGTPA